MHSVYGDPATKMISVSSFGSQFPIVQSLINTQINSRIYMLCIEIIDTTYIIYYSIRMLHDKVQGGHALWIIPFWFWIYI